MQEIDEMDIGYFLRVQACEARRKQEEDKTREPARRYIDEVWPE